MALFVPFAFPLGIAVGWLIYRADKSGLYDDLFQEREGGDVAWWGTNWRETSRPTAAQQEWQT
jgi:hypothetical protein